MKYTCIICVLSAFFAIPTFASANIIINEIAWMGTTISANDEWIELVNTGSEEVLLDGWTLSASDGSPDIPLAGSIDPQGYFLLERTDDDTVPNIPADIIFSGAMGNTGETLRLINASGSIVSEVNQSDGWLGGDNVTKQTLQWTGAQWITADPTPRSVNNASGVSQNSTSTNQSDPSSTQNQSTQTSSPSVASSTATSTTTTESNVTLGPRIDTSSYKAVIEIPDYGIVGVPLKFYAKVRKENIPEFRGMYFWNLGDGSSRTIQKDFENNFGFEYAYNTAGEYTVVFEYHPTAFDLDKPYVHTEKKIVLYDNILTLQYETFSKDIVLTSILDKKIDLAGWQLFTGSQVFTFSKATILQPKGVMHVSSRNHNFDNVSQLQLLTPRGDIVDQWQFSATQLQDNGTMISTVTPSSQEAFPKDSDVSFPNIDTMKPTTASLNDSIPILENIVTDSQSKIIVGVEKEKSNLLLWLGIATILMLAGGIVLVLIPEMRKKITEHLISLKEHYFTRPLSSDSSQVIIQNSVTNTSHKERV